MISPEIKARPREPLLTSLLASSMDPPAYGQDLGFPSLSDKRHSFLKLWFCFYILASTLGVCGSLSGCLVWLIAWNETVWTSEREAQRGRHSWGYSTNAGQLAGVQTAGGRSAMAPLWLQRETAGSTRKECTCLPTCIRHLWGSPEMCGRVPPHRLGARPRKLQCFMLPWSLPFLSAGWGRLGDLK